MERDQIAAMALQGLLASAPVVAEINIDEYAKAAVKLADALMEQLNQNENTHLSSHS